MKLTCNLQCFLQDVFDTRDVTTEHVSAPGDRGRLSLPILSNHPALIRNLCFAHAWDALVGAHPSRVDGRSHHAHVSSTGGMSDDDLAAYVIKSTALRLAAGTPELARRLTGLKASLPVLRAALAEGDGRALHRALGEKLTRRFADVGDAHAAEVPPTCMVGVMQLYARLTKGDAVAYYAGELETLSLSMSINPVTGTLLSRPAEARARLLLLSEGEEVTRADVVRHRLCHDMHLLRRSWGRVLVTGYDVVSSTLVCQALNDDDGDDGTDGDVALLLPPGLAFPSVLPDYWRGRVTVATGGAGATIPTAHCCVGSTSVLLLWGQHDSGRAGFTRVIRVVTCAEESRGTSNGTLVGEAYTLFHGEAAWTRDLFGAMLRRHLAHPTCPSVSRNPHDAVLLFEQALVTAAGSTLFPSPISSPGRAPPRIEQSIDSVLYAPFSVVAIDSRKRPASTVLSLSVTLMNLSLPTTARRRQVVVFCSRSNRAYLESAFASSPVLSHPSLDVTLCDDLVGLNGRGAFDVERAYNALLKGRDVWCALDRLGVRTALMVQDDGVVLRPGLESDATGFGDYAYVGAPWPDVPGYGPLRDDGNSGLVGNGGVSLRDVKAMLKIVDDPVLQRESRRLHLDDVQIVPEDVHFGWAVSSDPGLRTCPRDVALAFAAEQVAPEPSACLPYALHKPWPYWSVEVTRAVLARYASLRHDHDHDQAKAG